MAEFGFVSFAQEVVFTPGALARLGEAMDRFGWRRLLLCASRSMQTAGYVAEASTALGDRLCAAFDHVLPHVQDSQLAEVLALALEHDVDAVIGLGGGSPIGMAKAVAAALEEKQTGRPARAAYPTEQPIIPVVAIPTTYAGSEMTPTYGITHTDSTPPRKVTVRDAKIAPKLVVYDPRLTIDLPPTLTASTGMNALAHCIEALYSRSRHPASTAEALSAVRRIASALLPCYLRGDDLEARSEMMAAAHLAGLSLASVTMGLHHGLCHVLGGSANVPHGIANAIILPHVILFNARATAPLLLPAAEAVGISTGGANPVVAVENLAQWVSDLAGQMGLPQRLRDVGVKEEDLSSLAELAFQNSTVQNNPRPIQDAGEIERLLCQAL